MYQLIRKYESCELTSYKCPAGYWTIGYGSRFLKDGSSVKQGMKISYSEADELLEDYVKKNIEPCVNSMNINFSMEQKEALYSLIYNVGVNAFNKSKLKKAIVENNLEEIFKQWDWFKAGGKVLKGLVKRRAEELFLFTKDI